MPKAAESAPDLAANSPPSEATGKSPLFYAVISLAVLYCGFLIALAVFTANPVVLNPYQIRTSSLVVTASVKSSEKRGVTLKIEKIWKGHADTDAVFVRDLSPAQLNNYEVWIVPLERLSRDEYVVTPLKNASSTKPKQLLYPADPDSLDPADPDTLNKLKSLLSPGDASL